LLCEDRPAHLLEALFGRVAIPQAVHLELFAKTGAEASRLRQALATFAEVIEITDTAPEVTVATRLLDQGQRQAVTLAYQFGCPLVIDDRIGRQAARRLNLRVTGVVGVLLGAKQVGLVPSVGELLEELRARGYWLSDELVDRAARIAGEK
jgi:uncharacterized protein